MNLTKEACEILSQAIIMQAVDDYRKALRKRRRAQDKMAALARMRECERFFRSQWFAVLTDIDPESLINKLKDEYDDEQRRREALFAPIR